MNTTASREFVNETTKQMTDTFTTAMKTGTKMFEETARFWFDQAGTNVDAFRGKFEKLSDDCTPFGKKNAERFHRMFDEQAQKSLDVVRQGFEVFQAATPADAFDRMIGFYRTSFETMRQATESMTKANTEMFETWQSMMQNTCNTAGPSKNTTAKQPAAK